MFWALTAVMDFFIPQNFENWASFHFERENNNLFWWASLC